MATATKNATTDEILTMDEIRKRFDSEWVLIAEPETDQFHNVLGGRVIYHHSDRNVFDREVLELDPHPSDFAVFFTGKTPDGVSYLL